MTEKTISADLDIETAERISALVLEAALAGRANVLVTANFKDFLNKDIELIVPERHSIYHSPIHEFHIVHPYLRINWLNQSNIPKIL